MDSFNDLLHNKFGAYRYRPSIKVRTDAFYEYIPVENQKDQQVIARLGNKIIDLSDACFHACVDPAHKYYTYTEKKCVRACVERYFQGFESIVAGTVNRMKEERERAKIQERQAQIVNAESKK